MRKLAIIWSILLIGLTVPAWSQEKPDGRKAWETVNYLASNEFQGRKSGTEEYQKAAEYVALKMAEYGLKPAGENGSYFQTVDFKKWRHFGQPTRLEITSPVHRIYFAGRGRDFHPNSGTGSGIVKGQIAFVGYGIVSEENGWDDYAGLDVSGKIVMMMPGVPKPLSEELKKEKPLEKKLKTAIAKGASGVIIMNVGEGVGGRRFPAGAKKGVCPDGFVVMTADSNFCDDVFYTADRSWKYLVSKTLREKKSFNTLLDITVEMEAHYIEEDRQAPNVIGILPGKDRKLKNEYILIGGHLDHIGIGVDGFICNGADDNAASVAVILEIARVLQANKFKPGRTVVFCAWAGEELGLVGSRFYAKHPLFPLEKTAVYMNMDMVGQGDLDMCVGCMWEFADFFSILKQNMQDKFKDRLRFRLKYRGSDHSAFLPKGVTCISLRSGNVLTRTLDDEHPEYHRPGDMAETIEPELLQQAAEYHMDNITFLSHCKENLLDPKHHLHFLHKDANVVDLHCDTIGRVLRGADLSQDNPKGHIDIPKLKQGAVDLQVFACYVGPSDDVLVKNQAAKKVFRLIDGVHRLIGENENDLALIKSSQDFRGLSGTGKTGILIGIEGGYAIENELALLRSFHQLGVRLMTLTHWTRTDWADASGDETPKFQGLTEFGEDVVKEMNRLGMIIDVSHSHDETFWDVIHLSKSPIVASHSCCRALSDHHRNLTDEMLKALAKNGGMVGINYHPGFLNAENDNKITALREEIAAKYGIPSDMRAQRKADQEEVKQFNQEFIPRAKQLRESMPKVDVKTVVDHIDHVVKVTGNANHVGLGSDFDGISSTPEGLENTGKLLNITRELKNRGYKESDIRKILGGNFIRILQKVCKD